MQFRMEAEPIHFQQRGDDAIARNVREHRELLLEAKFEPFAQRLAESPLHGLLLGRG